MQEKQESPVYRLDPALTRAFRRAFVSGRNPVALCYLVETFRFFEKDQYEDPKMQARVLGQRDVILEILRQCGILEDPMALCRALVRITPKAPQALEREADMGAEDLDLRE